MAEIDNISDGGSPVPFDDYLHYDLEGSPSPAEEDAAMKYGNKDDGRQAFPTQGYDGSSKRSSIHSVKAANEALLPRSDGDPLNSDNDTDDALERISAVPTAFWQTADLGGWEENSVESVNDLVNRSGSVEQVGGDQGNFTAAQEIGDSGAMQQARHGGLSRRPEPGFHRRVRNGLDVSPFARNSTTPLAIPVGSGVVPSASSSAGQHLSAEGGVDLSDHTHLLIPDKPQQQSPVVAVKLSSQRITRWDPPADMRQLSDTMHRPSRDLLGKCAKVLTNDRDVSSRVVTMNDTAKTQYCFRLSDQWHDPWCGPVERVKSGNSYAYACVRCGQIVLGDIVKVNGVEVAASGSSWQYSCPVCRWTLDRNRHGSVLDLITHMVTFKPVGVTLPRGEEDPHSQYVKNQ
ncbi:hypothetical protein DFJ73DRAFT_755636 [Zopfochytrium polystomum]|nr:hypothetical protein DFJ73DRAFT_755636 [Zopfochytrium polystomum]